MLLAEIRLPDLNGNSFSTEKQIRQIFEYMIQLNKKLDFVLQNIDTENMTEEMRQTVTNMVAASREIETKVSNNEFMSVMKQTAEAIELRVQKDEVISSINMSPEEITIKAQRISLEGVVTVNGYFKIDEDGKMTATGGRIAGWTIDDGALYTGENTAEISPALYLGTKDIQKSTAIAGSADRKDWRIKVRAAFGVTADGTVYAQDGDFRGTVSAGKIKYGTDESGTNRGTMNGNGITINSIYNTRVASNTLTQDEMEKAYASLKADVATLKTLYTGLTISGRLVTSRLDVMSTMYFRDVNVYWATVNGVRVLAGQTM